MTFNTALLKKPDLQSNNILSFITTPTSLLHVDLPIVRTLPKRYKSGVYPLRYSFKIHFCAILSSKHFFSKCFLTFRSSGRNLEYSSHIFFLLQALAYYYHRLHIANKYLNLEQLRSSNVFRKACRIYITLLVNNSFYDIAVGSHFSTKQNNSCALSQSSNVARG